jgi:plastocyanin domain-containing protein
MIILLTNFIGIILIAAIVWWFWLGKSAQTKVLVTNIIDIAVDGGIYIPAAIQAKQGSHITLRFTRYDASPCAEMVVFPDLGVSAELPVKKPFDIPLTLAKTGEFEFTCAMGMYRGKLIVEP